MRDRASMTGNILNTYTQSSENPENTAWISSLILIRMSGAGLEAEWCMGYRRVR